MKYTVSRKNSFKWSIKDDILHYDTPLILALIQQPAPICNCFFRIKKKNTSFKNFHCRCQLGNKDSKYSFKQNTVNIPSLLQYNFSKDEMFENRVL